MHFYDSTDYRGRLHRLKDRSKNLCNLLKICVIKVSDLVLGSFSETSKKTLISNAANFIVLLRTLLVFLIVGFFSLDFLVYRVVALILLVFITFLDWLDGHIARRYNLSSQLGGLIDTLGDRITENVLLIFFAYRRLVPLAVPVIFVSRSFVADLIRHLAYLNNVSTFEINKSKWGFVFVASRTSRVLYLLLKMAIFFLAGIILVMEAMVIQKPFQVEGALLTLRQVVLWGAVALVLFNLIRFIFLVYDSRGIIKESLKNTK